MPRRNWSTGFREHFGPVRPSNEPQSNNSRGVKTNANDDNSFTTEQGELDEVMHEAYGRQTVADRTGDSPT